MLNLTGVGDPGHIGISVPSIVELTPEACIDLLRLWPLLFGTAWKVLDLLLEAAWRPMVRRPTQRTGVADRREVAKAKGQRPALSDQRSRLGGVDGDLRRH